MLIDERIERDRLEPRRIRLSSALLWGAIGLLLTLLIFEMTVNSLYDIKTSWMLCHLREHS